MVPSLDELPAGFQEQVPEQHLVRGGNRGRREKVIIMRISVTLFNTTRRV